VCGFAVAPTAGAISTGADICTAISGVSVTAGSCKGQPTASALHRVLTEPFLCNSVAEYLGQPGCN
jgi:hypothetical protein